MAECSITVRSLLYCSCHQLPMKEIAHSISKLQTGHVSSPGCTLARDVGAFGDQEIKEASDGGFQMFSRGLPENHVEHSLRIETWAVLHSCAIFKRPKFGNSIFTHTDTHTHTNIVDYCIPSIWYHPGCIPWNNAYNVDLKCGSTDMASQTLPVPFSHYIHPTKSVAGDPVILDPLRSFLWTSWLALQLKTITLQQTHIDKEHGRHGPFSDEWCQITL